MRLFIAVRPGDQIVKDLVATQQALKTGAAFRDCRWIPPENLHLTVHFLGEVDEPRLAALSAGLSALPPAPLALPQTLDRLTAFPHPRAATVLVLGAAAVSPSLAAAYESVKRLLVEIGIAVERRAYSPHVTLARLKRPARWRLEDFPEVPTFTVEATTLSLFASRHGATGTQGAHGSRYRVLMECPLPA